MLFDKKHISTESMYTKISYSRMKVLINTLEASDKQVVDLATETLYSQQVEMVLYFQLLLFCCRGTSLL